MSGLKKKIGVGSTSILLFIAGLLFSFNFNNGVCFGDSILNYLGLNAWSKGTQGTHYTIFYSSIFFILSVIIGHKFKEDFGSKLGKILSSIILIIMLIIIIFSVFFSIRI